MISTNNFDNNIASISGRKLLLIALSLVLLTHGIILYFTLPKTYDAFVHIFFADHYARFWFEPFDYRWYTGFETTSYPPLVHQVVALLSKVFPLKVAFVIYSIAIYELLVVGMYRFSKLFVNQSVAGVAALLTVLSSALIETVHVYGQLPTITGLAFLLNALPFLYQYFIKPKAYTLIMALVFLALVVCSHHVTVIFGLVFFIAPTLFMALADSIAYPSANFRDFSLQMWLVIRKKWWRIIGCVLLILSLVIGLILPYWVWSHENPITQVSIPHGSRDNFFENSSSALMFYIIPLALIIALLFAIVYQMSRQKRNLIWLVSFVLALILGSGGTTPIPRLLLGENAYNILTLDRFGLWAAIIAIPFMAHFVYSFVYGWVYKFWIKKWGENCHFVLAGMSGLSYFLFLIFIFHLASFRPLQPNEIETEPISNFINRDQHINWRYLTLGFGDQMAWLSANTLASTVDGNYHSARKLPELTSRPIERLENAKYAGDHGIASLNDFLTQSEKYHLKFVFSNDKYYDPILFFSGWNRSQRLENGIMVWEKDNITSIKPLEMSNTHPVLRMMWAILPISMLIIGVIMSIIYLLRYKPKNKSYIHFLNDYYPSKITKVSSLSPLIFFTLLLTYELSVILFHKEQKDPESTVQNYYNHLDYQEFEKAFSFIKKAPNYDLNRYLLEKSAKDGGLFPNYARLDSIQTKLLSQNNTQSKVAITAYYNTSLGNIVVQDSLSLEKHDNQWFILPQAIHITEPEEQVLQYEFTVFKKLGKRKVSSFPTRVDDRIKKPFIQITEMRWLEGDTGHHVLGELINADNLPINFMAQLSLEYQDGSTEHYYPRWECTYNLSPKEKGYFKIPFSPKPHQKIVHIEINFSTNVSQSGYLKSGVFSYQKQINPSNSSQLVMENNLPFDLTIPSALAIERDADGSLMNLKLHPYDHAIKSGQKVSWCVQEIPTKLQKVDRPIRLVVNGGEREFMNPKNLSTLPPGFSYIPHSYISDEYYVH